MQRVTGREIALSEFGSEILRIGRGTNADLRSDNQAVALEHAVIEGSASGYRIVDQGSITGTYVNRQPIESATLHKGDVIEIGDLRIEVQVAEGGKPLFIRVSAGAQRAAVLDDFEEPSAATEDVAAGRGILRAQKVDYAGAYRLSRPWLTRGTIVILALILTLTAVRALTRPENQTVFKPGDVSSAHSRARDANDNVIANDCEACHHPWQGVTDARCMNCHKRVRHAETEANTPACLTCHSEHRGLQKLALVDNERCAACHANLPAHATPGAVLAANRKKITAFGIDHPPFTIPADENQLPGFSHAMHLAPATPLRNGKGEVEQLECASCHQLAGAIAKPAPIQFEAHCSRCHALTFDDALPDAQVPHGGDPQLVYAAVVAAYTRDRDLVGKSPQEIRRILAQRSVTPAGDRAVFAAEQVIDKKCGNCHELQRREGRIAVTAPVFRTKWLDESKFTHARHRMVGCERCHDAARKSENASDVLIPAEETCVACHGPQQEIGSSTCITCHDYHQRITTVVGR
ncbi:MAG TPA: FHA domain-containing protein [Thermoanaerobaculia bacterium]